MRTKTPTIKIMIIQVLQKFVKRTSNLEQAIIKTGADKKTSFPKE